MPYVVDFQSVATTGLESSPVADALAGLRANEARYFRNKYNHVFTVEPAAKAKDAVELVNRVLKERNIEIQSPALEATSFQVENIRWTYVFYQSGLSINVLYTLDGPAPKRAVGLNSPKAWTCLRNSAPSSSHVRSQNSPGRSVDPISSSRASTSSNQRPSRTFRFAPTIRTMWRHGLWNLAFRETRLD